MCDQNNIALAQLGATGLAAGSNYQKARYEASIARQNAILAERGAYRTEQVGAEQYTEIVRRGRQLEGKQRAAMGAAGIDPNVGQALALLEDDAYTNAADAQSTLNNAARSAEALRIEAASSKAFARNRRKAAPFEAGATALTGGSRAYGIWKGV